MRTKTLLAAAAALLMMSAPALAQVDTAATHAIILDADTGAVLLDKNADAQMPTSSMSKVITLYEAFSALKDGRLKLTDELPVSEKAWRMQGSKMFIKVGSNVKVDDLIRGVAIQSGNDATIALAEGIAGSEEAFAERLNHRAADLGMKNSHFMNASGWPVDGHYSTPRDLATLGLRIMHDFPEHYHYFSEKEFVYNNIRQQNRDPLLGKVPGADGIKTGHTEIAGYGLIGSAKRDGRRLVLVINGLPSTTARAEEASRLMEWGFRNFENRTLVKAGEAVDTAQVWLGENEVSLVPEKDVTVVLPVARRNDVKMTITYKGPIQAPVKKDDAVASLRIEVPDQPAMEIKLLAGGDVARKGIFGRVAERFSYLAGTL